VRVRISKRLPVALSIAGSDSGGGAGIQADLKTFTALGVHGTTALSCITAQNPTRVFAIEPCTRAVLRAQIEAVFEALPPDAVKTGMLYSAEIIRLVAQWFASRERPPLVVDPVMIATSKARLLQSSALRALTNQLLPLATLVTPNLHEAAVLSGEARLRSVEDLRQAACSIQGRFGCAALVKGGHLPGRREAVDILNDGKDEWLLQAPFLRGLRTHGTGCTYSAAITAFLARGYSLPESVQLAKQYITEALARSYTAGHHLALGIPQHNFA
jgi:hydroxymethylpyrimidine/phosphomethylpyrimidine kinase